MLSFPNRPTTWTWTKDLATDKDFYDVDLVYNLRGDVLRTIDNIFLNPGGAISHYYDRTYALDALGRVLGEDRGDWDGTGIGTTREDRNWSLTAVGNWASRDYDLDGLGTDFAEDNTPIGTHFNNANEWIQRNITTGGSPVTPLYDDNGNLIDDDKDYVYEYDAWNRLTSISTTGGSPTLVAEYRYNGLGHRISEGDGTDTEYLIYDDRWRLISRHDGSSAYLEETLYHHAGLDGYGGASDVDSVIMRRTFLTTGSPRQTEDQRWYVLQNWRQDVAVIIDEAAVQRERAFFSPYGRVFGMVAGDTGFDGDYGAGDSSAITGWSTAYRAYADVDLDGTIDATDASYTTNETMGWDALSRDGSTVGYAGYTQDDFIATVSHVRHRVYKTDLGRWVQRDPAGYVDGANLYEYVMGQPIKMRDAMGLASVLNQDDPEERRRKRELRHDDWRNLTRKDCEVGVACQNIGPLPFSHCYTYIDCGKDATWICDGGPDKKRKFSSATSGIDESLTSGCYKCPDVSPRDPTELKRPERDPIPNTPAWDCQNYEETKRGKETGRKTKSQKGLPWDGAGYRNCFERVTRRMNSCGYNYDLMGPNSNTVAGCLAAICLGVTEPPPDAAWAPGWGWGGWGACDCEASD